MFVPQHMHTQITFRPPMIDYNTYVCQVIEIYKSGQLHDVASCEFVGLSSSTYELRARFKFIASELNSSNTYTLYILEVLVEYEKTFQEPQLAFRIWESGRDSSYSIQYELDAVRSFLPPWFVLNIDIVKEEPWYIVGVCDTPAVIGGSLDNECYLHRWIAVYLLNWIKSLPCQQEGSDSSSIHKN